MTEKELEFVELLLANGRRKVGDEWHGMRTGEIADQVGLDRHYVVVICSEWMAKGWYDAEEGFTLQGYVTPVGHEELRKLL